MGLSVLVVVLPLIIGKGRLTPADDPSVAVKRTIEEFFDEVDHGHLRSFLDRRVTDGIVRRTMHKWLNAGVMESGNVSYPDSGTPQGGVISPLLANVMLHEVLDQWFVTEVMPRLQGRAQLVRYADDFVVICEQQVDAQRVLAVLPKRLGRFGLKLHPDKTRIVRFERPSESRRGDMPRPESFELLGFTHYWGQSRRGAPIVKRKTSRVRLNRAIKRVWELCKRLRHAPLRVQQAMLARQLQGHYSYYGITGNAACLGVFYFRVLAAWKNALSRRGGRRLIGERFYLLLDHYRLPSPRVVHSIYRRPVSP